MTSRLHSIETFGTVDGPGIRVVLFFQGCPMRCQYCHNRDTWDTAGGREWTLEDLKQFVLRFKPYMDTSGGGVTATGGDPVLQHRFITRLFTQLKEEGVHTALDTSGFCRYEDVKPLIDVTDLVILDIKAVEPGLHKRLAGQNNAMILRFVDKLRELYGRLIAQGAHYINLVTPTPYKQAILASLAAPLPVPVVYNCGGYESVHTVAFLRNKVQCWLPDLKYMDSKASKRYSDAPDYFEKASAAIEQMFRQTGPYEIGPDGILKKGVLIRHLILPGQVEDTKRIMEYIAETFAPGDVLFSLMRQYIPYGRASEFPEINRRITDEEYEECESYMEDLGITDGYVQAKESSDKAFIPIFDGTGVLESAHEGLDQK